jgi:hypothetical protein
MARLPINGDTHAGLCHLSIRRGNQYHRASKRLRPGEHSARTGIFAERSICIRSAGVVIQHLVCGHQLHDVVQCHGRELSKQLSGARSAPVVADGDAK